MTFHAEHIGSFVRPQRLVDAARAHKAGKLDDAGFKAAQDEARYEAMGEKQVAREIRRLEKEMAAHARNLEFEKAAALRDRLAELRKRVFGVALVSE